MSGTTGNFKSSAARSSNMKVGDLVELTWKLGEHLGAAMDVGIVIHIQDLSRPGIDRKDIAVTAVFGSWRTTQLQEYFRLLSDSSR